MKCSKENSEASTKYISKQLFDLLYWIEVTIKVIQDIWPVFCCHILRQPEPEVFPRLSEKYVCGVSLECGCEKKIDLWNIHTNTFSIESFANVRCQFNFNCEYNSYIYIMKDMYFFHDVPFKYNDWDKIVTLIFPKGGSNLFRMRKY